MGVLKGFSFLVGAALAVLITEITRSLPSRREAARLRRELDIQRRTDRRLKEDEAARDRFISLLGHELRGPLATLHAAVELLEKTEDPELLQTVREALGIRTRQLGRLVEDLIDSSRLDRGTLVLQRQDFDLRVAVGRAAESVKTLLGDQGHRLLLSVPEQIVPVNGDPARIERGIVNLLVIAGKYIRRGGEIALALEEREDTATIRIRENGSGINPEMRSLMMQDPERTHSSRSMGKGGSGIGLHLLPRLIEMHGGTVESGNGGSGRGVEFAICLPVLQAKERFPAVNA